MRIIILCVILSGCSISRYETLDNCAVIHEAFMGYTYHRTVDCSDQENPSVMDKMQGED